MSNQPYPAPIRECQKMTDAEYEKALDDLQERANRHIMDHLMDHMIDQQFKFRKRTPSTKEPTP